MLKSAVLGLVLASMWLIAPAAPGSAQAAARSVLTFHYDKARTGWNNQERTLTPSNVAGGQFGRLYQVALDGQVDAQPLLVPGVAINGQAYSVLYIAT